MKGPWLLCLDRTNWQIGSKHVNVLVLALVTRRHRVPLMWSMMGGRWPGNSPTAARIALMDRHLALFGAGSVKMLLADREFIGGEWLRYLHANNAPFTIRLRENMTVITEAGEQCQLRGLLKTTRGARSFRLLCPASPPDVSRVASCRSSRPARMPITRCPSIAGDGASNVCLATPKHEV